MKMYVSDIIGDDYKNWQPKNRILLQSQTGTGKTTFILKKLLPYAAEHNKYLVYICNRKVLSEQNKEKINNIDIELSSNILGDKDIESKYSDNILITTYQHRETAKEFPYFKIDEEHFISESDVMYYILTKHIISFRILFSM